MKTKSQFVCQSCGATAAKWTGRCDGCGEWNTLQEETVAKLPASVSRRSASLAFSKLSGTTPDEPRIRTGMPELDRVLGGGIVPGSTILIGGDPGIGKSTLLLQMSSKLARAGVPCAYVSGEESIQQIQLRAQRLGLADAPVDLATTNDARVAVQSLSVPNGPKVVVIDSIQTMTVPELDAAQGTVSQIRAATTEFIRMAKDHGVAVFIVGHVTKDGNIAGPKVLEHAVDTVLYFEGDSRHQYRILRGNKNRFGATDEIGVFQMRDDGLADVSNPSEIFLSDRRSDISGSVVFPSIEGSRPILVEIQALVSPAAYGSPRRAVVGWDSGRLAMVLAVLEAHAGISLGSQDVYLNVVGGFRITEPAADLAVATALLSSITKAPMADDLIIFGEIGLGGEIRPVNQSEQRIKEASKLGFSSAYLPKPPASAKPSAASIKRAISLSRVGDLVKHFEIS